VNRVAAQFVRLTQAWRGDAVALIAGALTPLAFSPYSWWPLAIITLAVLFALWLFSTTPRQSMRRGFLFGLGLFSIGISWVFISIHYHGFVGFGLSLFLTLLLIVVMAFFPALLGYLLGRYFGGGFESRATRYKLLLVMPAGWVLTEWVRGWFMTGFPWLSLGYSQTDSLLAGVAPVLGVYGVSWAVAFSAALLVAFAFDKKGRIFYPQGLLVLWLLAMVANDSTWTSTNGAPMRVALLQGNVPQDIKWHPDVRRPTIDLYAEMTREHWDADLIIWPETALPAFYYEAENFLDDLEAQAQQHNTDLLIGMLTLDKDRRHYYNTMMSLGDDRGRYSKNHLVPFTEYLPLKSVLGGLIDFMQVPMSDFSRGGSEQKPLKVARQAAGISICFEDAFGEEVIDALPEATFLVNVSNDAWFDNSWAPPQHLQMARMRALETGRPMLRATNTGITAIIDEKGKILKRAPQFEVASISEVIQPRTGMTPYTITGNWLVVTLAILFVGYAVWCLKKKAAEIVS
jgi:apolipoprotein N-acyltransferase